MASLFEGELRSGQAATSSFICTPIACHLVAKRLLDGADVATGTVHGIVQADAAGAPQLLQSSSNAVDDEVRFDPLQLAEQGGMVVAIEPPNELVHARETLAEGVLQGTRVRTALAEYVTQQALLDGLARHAGLGHQVFVKAAAGGELLVVVASLYRAKRRGVIYGSRLAASRFRPATSCLPLPASRCESWVPVTAYQCTPPGARAAS